MNYTRFIFFTRHNVSVELERINEKEISLCIYPNFKGSAIVILNEEEIDSLIKDLLTIKHSKQTNNPDLHLEPSCEIDYPLEL